MYLARSQFFPLAVLLSTLVLASIEAQTPVYVTITDSTGDTFHAHPWSAQTGGVTVRVAEPNGSTPGGSWIAQWADANGATLSSTTAFSGATTLPFPFASTPSSQLAYYQLVITPPGGAPDYYLSSTYAGTITNASWLANQGYSYPRVRVEGAPGQYGFLFFPSGTLSTSSRQANFSSHFGVVNMPPFGSLSNPYFNGWVKSIDWNAANQTAMTTSFYSKWGSTYLYDRAQAGLKELPLVESDSGTYSGFWGFDAGKGWNSCTSLSTTAFVDDAPPLAWSYGLANIYNQLNASSTSTTSATNSQAAGGLLYYEKQEAPTLAAFGGPTATWTYNYELGLEESANLGGYNRYWQNAPTTYDDYDLEYMYYPADFAEKAAAMAAAAAAGGVSVNFTWQDVEWANPPIAQEFLSLGRAGFGSYSTYAGGATASYPVPSQNVSFIAMHPYAFQDNNANYGTNTAYSVDYPNPETWVSEGAGALHEWIRTQGLSQGVWYTEMAVPFQSTWVNTITDTAPNLTYAFGYPNSTETSSTASDCVTSGTYTNPNWGNVVPVTGFDNSTASGATNSRYDNGLPRAQLASYLAKEAVISMYSGVSLMMYYEYQDRNNLGAGSGCYDPMYAPANYGLYDVDGFPKPTAASWINLQSLLANASLTPANESVTALIPSTDSNLGTGYTAVSYNSSTLSLYAYDFPATITASGVAQPAHVLVDWQYPVTTSAAQNFFALRPGLTANDFYGYPANTASNSAPYGIYAVDGTALSIPGNGSSPWTVPYGPLASPTYTVSGEPVYLVVPPTIVQEAENMTSTYGGADSGRTSNYASSAMSGGHGQELAATAGATGQWISFNFTQGTPAGNTTGGIPPGNYYLVVGMRLGPTTGGAFTLSTSTNGESYTQLGSSSYTLSAPASFANTEVLDTTTFSVTSTGSMWFKFGVTSNPGTFDAIIDYLKLVPIQN